jgi:hypothetical protein
MKMNKTALLLLTTLVASPAALAEQTPNFNFVSGGYLTARSL